MTDKLCGTCQHFNLNYSKGEVGFGPCMLGVHSTVMQELNGEPLVSEDFGCVLHAAKPDWIEECARIWHTPAEIKDHFGIEGMADHIREHHSAAKERGEA